MPHPRRPITYATIEQPGHARVELGCRGGFLYRRAKGHNDWLKIHGRITCPDGEWSFADPALDAAEMLELIAWLRAGPDAARPSLSFTEPCLAFAMAAAGAGRARLSITFRGEAAPPWIHDDDEALWHTGFTLDLELPEAVIRRFGEELERIAKGE